MMEGSGPCGRFLKTFPNTTGCFLGGNYAKGLASGLPADAAAALDLSQVPKYVSGPKYENLRKEFPNILTFFLLLFQK